MVSKHPAILLFSVLALVIVSASILCISDDSDAGVTTYRGVEYCSSDDGTAEVTFVDPSLQSISISNTVIINGKEYAVRSIADGTVNAGVFSNCKSLDSVNLGSIRYIGSSAFDGCTSLKTITGTKVTEIGYRAFSNCTSLKNIDMPVTVCGPSAFSGCSSLSSATMNLKTVSENMFRDCTSLVSANVGTIATVCSDGFRGCTSLSTIETTAGLVTISDRSFMNCAGIHLFTIGEGCTYIAEDAFKGCDNISFSVSENNPTISNDAMRCLYTDNGKVLLRAASNLKDYYSVSYGVTRIVEHAFDGCETLTDLSIPATVVDMGYILNECKALQTVELMASVTAIPDGLFSDCTSLTNVILSDTIQTIPARTFKNCFSLDTVGYSHSEPGNPTPKIRYYNETVLLSDSVTTIGNEAFSACSSIINVEGGKAAYIGDRAFIQCSSLKTFELPKETTHIGDSCFKNCGLMNMFNVSGPHNRLNITTGDPQHVFELGTEAFRGCTNLNEILVLSGLATIPDRSFMYCESLTEIQTDANIIGTDSFNGCINLKTMDMSSIIRLGDGAFRGCDSLDVLRISENTDYIGNMCFSECESLWRVWLPMNGAETGRFVFSDCSKLSSLIYYRSEGNEIITPQHSDFAIDLSKIKTTMISAPVSYIPANLISQMKNAVKIVLPNTLTAVEPNMFQGFKDLRCIGICTPGAEGEWTDPEISMSDTEVNFTSNLHSIGDYAFEGCSSIGSLYLTDGTVNVGSYAFAGCTQLRTADCTSVNAFGTDVFSGCSNLKSVKMTGVTSITDRMFKSCSSMNECIIDKIVTVGEQAFHGCKKLSSVPTGFIETIYKEGFYGCAALNISDLHSLYSLDVGAFNGCRSLENVDVGDITGIKMSTFCGCIKLESITMDSVETIGERAFQDCTALGSVNLKSVITFGERAFQGCANISIDSFSDNLQKIDAWAFSNCNLNGCLKFPLNGHKVGVGAFSSVRELSSIEYIDSMKNTYPTFSENAFGETNKCWVFGLPASMDHSGFYGDGWRFYEYKSSVTDIEENGLFFHRTSASTAELTGISEKLQNTEEIHIPAFIEFPDKPLNVTYIKPTVFAGNKNLRILSLPDLIPQLDKECFKDCTALENLTFVDTESSVKFIKIGASAFENCTSLKNVSFDSAPSEIGNRAFYGCRNLVTVSAPHVDSPDGGIIGGSAYYGCSSLKTPYIPSPIVELPGSIFNGCEALESFFVPAGITDLREYMFFGCTALKTVTLPDSMQTIGESVFRNCTSLNSIELPAGLTGIGVSAFSSCAALTSFTVPAGITDLNNQMLSGCTALTTVTLPDSLQTIGESAFRDCTSLNSIELPAGLTGIGVSAFNGCTALTTITVPAGVTDLHECTFSECTALTTVTLPNSLQTISESAFRDCTSLNSIELPGSLTSIGSSAFSGCTSLSTVDAIDVTVTTPSPVKSIGTYAFSDCPNLRTVKLPSTITLIGEGIFKNCYKLEQFSAAGLNTIGSDSFAGCTKLQNFSAPLLSNIGERAFSGCSAIVSQPFSMNTVNIGVSAFSGCTGLTILEIPSKGMTIGDGAFTGCSSLNEVYFVDPGTSAQKTQMGNGAFDCNITAVCYVFGLGAESRDTAVFTGNGWLFYLAPEDIESIIMDGYKYVLISDRTAVQLAEIPSSLKTQNTVSLPDDITFPGMDHPYNVVSLKPNLLECFEAVTVNLPNKLTSLDNRIFMDCKNLSSISIPDSVSVIGDSTFKGCTNLSTVTFSGSLQKIGNSAFENCIGLKDIAFNSTPSDIGSRAFYGCKNLVTVSAPASDCLDGGIIGGSAYYGCISLTKPYIPSTITELSNATFSGCTALIEVQLPASLNDMGDYVFMNCSSLASIELPTTMSGIGRSAFNGCTTLASFTIPEGITDLREYTFLGCVNLKTVTLPDSLQTIGDSAFEYCDKLESANPPATMSSIGRSAFNGCTNLASFTIPEGITDLHEHTFSGCTNLNTVTFPSTLKTIGDSAFYRCSNMHGAEFPDSLSYVGTNAFFGCSSLSGLVLPKYNLNLGERAFEGCDSVESIDFLGDRPYSNLEFGIDSFKIAGHCYVFGLWSDAEDRDRNAFTGGDMEFYLKRSDVKSVTADGITYNRNEDGDSVTVTHVLSGCNNIPDEVTFPDKKLKVVGLTDYLYADDTSLKAVYLPGTLKSIGANTFKGCTSLETVGFGSVQADVVLFISIGDSAFRDCTALSSLTLPSGIASLGNNAFYGCRSLTTFTANSTQDITSLSEGEAYPIGDSCFFECTKLKNIILPSNITSIGNQAFCGCKALPSMTIPSNVTSIGKEAFKGCGSLTSIVIPSNVRSIDDRAFCECSSLTSVIVKSNIASMGKETFNGCSSLESLTTDITQSEPATSKNKTTFIDDRCFKGCAKLRTVELPCLVSSMGMEAFVDCTSLTSFTVYGTQYAYSTPDVMRPYIGDRCFSGCSNLITVELPYYIKTIGQEAFNGCEKLSELSCITQVQKMIGRGLIIPTSVTAVGTSAFSGCASAENALLPNGLTELAECMFMGCSGLRTIDMSQECTMLPRSLFEGCALLGTMSDGTPCTWTVPDHITAIADRAFSGCGFSELNLHNSLNYISSSAVDDCRNLSSITLPTPDENNQYDSYMGMLIDKNGYISRCPENIKTTSIDLTSESEIIGIGKGAFHGCTKIKEVTLGDSIRYIGDSAFDGCGSLQAMHFDHKMEHAANIKFGSDIFNGCITLKLLDFGRYSPNNGESLDLGKIGEHENLTVWRQSEKLFVECDGVTNVSFVNCEPCNITKYIDGQQPVIYSFSLPKNIKYSINKDGSVVTYGHDSKPVRQLDLSPFLDSGKCDYVTDGNNLRVYEIKMAIFSVPESSGLENKTVYYLFGYVGPVNEDLYVPSGYVCSPGKGIDGYEYSWNALNTTIRYTDNTVPSHSTPIIYKLTYDLHVNDVTIDSETVEFSNVMSPSQPKFDYLQSEGYVITDDWETMFDPNVHADQTVVLNACTYLVMEGSAVVGLMDNFDSTEVYIPDVLKYDSNLVINTVENIDSSKIQIIHLGGNISRISETAFIDCIGLSRFTVSDGNRFFTELDGVLYSYSMQNLVSVPALYGEIITIPETVDTISTGAFTGDLMKLQISGDKPVHFQDRANMTDHEITVSFTDINFCTSDVTLTGEEVTVDVIGSDNMIAYAVVLLMLLLIELALVIHKENGSLKFINDGNVYVFNAVQTGFATVMLVYSILELQKSQNTLGLTLVLAVLCTLVEVGIAAYTYIYQKDSHILSKMSPAMKAMAIIALIINVALYISVGFLPLVFEGSIMSFWLMICTILALVASVIYLVALLVCWDYIHKSVKETL